MLKMKTFTKIILVTLAMICSFAATAQELNCTFEVDSKKVKNANKDIFNTLINGKLSIGPHRGVEILVDCLFQGVKNVFVGVLHLLRINLKGAIQLLCANP